jgi:chromosome segregation ATPase
MSKRSTSPIHSLTKRPKTTVTVTANVPDTAPSSITAELAASTTPIELAFELRNTLSAHVEARQNLIEERQTKFTEFFADFKLSNATYLTVLEDLEEKLDEAESALGEPHELNKLLRNCREFTSQYNAAYASSKALYEAKRENFKTKLEDIEKKVAEAKSDYHRAERQVFKHAEAELACEESQR